MRLIPWRYNSEYFARRKNGISIIEILVVIAIISIALGSLLELAVFALKSSTLTKEEVEAGILAQKTLEEARSFRDGTSWDSVGIGSLTVGSAYHTVMQATATSTIWAMSSGEETLGNYTRKIVLYNVSRDPITGNIDNVYNPGNFDPDTRKVVATVSWGSKILELVTYLTNWRQ